MSFPLWDLFKDMAVARGLASAEVDPAKRAAEALAMRRRLAAIAWIPGPGAVLFLGGATNSAVIGVAGFVVLVVALWLFAERGDRLAAALRRGRPQA